MDSLRPPEPTEAPGERHDCPGDHGEARNPTLHPRLGMVPAMSSVIIGAVALGLVIGASSVWFSAALPYLFGLILLGLLASFAVQLALGHRGRCLVNRTLRWWLGPIGSLIDPIEMG